jgi:small subunit ribosomal protein S11
MAQSSKRKIQKTIVKGKIYITATFNNTIITVTDEKGTPFLFGGCGMFGFTGTRKSTPYAATVTVEKTLRKAMDNFSFSEAEVFIKGIGPGREASLRAIKPLGLEIHRIVDVTPVPHNGVRPPKLRKG